MSPDAVAGTPRATSLETHNGGDLMTKTTASIPALGYAIENAARAGVPLTRPQRDQDLMTMSGGGLIGVELDVALKLADRARSIEYADADKKLLKLRKIITLDLQQDVPSWIGELHHLRTLKGTVPGKLPSSLLKLQHLHHLHVEDSDELDNLDGIEKLRGLEFVTCSRTPIAEQDGALEAVAKRIRGAKVSPLLPGIEVARTPSKPPTTKQAIIKAINDDTLDDGSDLQGVDLSGARFEHAYVAHDLRGARLANTIWISCDFHDAKLAGADLTGAVFYDCYFNCGTFGLGMFENVKAPRATFIGCGGTLAFQRADLRDAAVLEMDSDYNLQLEEANAQGIVLQASFCSEKEHDFVAKRADLRGACVFFDITAGRRAELGKKKKPRLAWKTDQFKGAKTDKTTQIRYASLDCRIDPTALSVTTFGEPGRRAG